MEEQTTGGGARAIDRYVRALESAALLGVTDLGVTLMADGTPWEQALELATAAGFPSALGDPPNAVPT